MSGAKGETTATFYAALDKTNVGSKQLVDSIDRYLSTFVRTTADKSLTKQKEAGEYIDIVTQTKKTQEQFVKELNDYFKTESEFLNELVYEAMSGHVKFGDKAISRANYILVFGMDGTKNFLYPVLNSSSDIVKHKALQIAGDKK